MGNELVTESVASLRAALSAVQTAYGEIPQMERESDDYDSVGSRLRYMAQTLRGLIRNEWVDQQAFPSVESLAGWPAERASEAGAKFSTATRTAVLDVVRSLKALVGIEEPDAESKAALVAATDEVAAGVEALIADLDTKVAAVEALLPSSGNGTAWSTALFVQEGSNPDQNQYRMLVIKEGLSGNRNMWKGPVLEAATGLLEGRPIFLDHAAGAERGTPAPRSIADRVGWWSEPAYVKDLVVGEQKVSGIVATANILTHSAHPWLSGMIREALAKGQPDIVGVSIDAPVNGKIRPDSTGKLFRDIESIVAFSSADIVALPGAGGQPLAVLEGLLRDEEIMELESLTVEQLQEARPDLFTQIVASATPPAAPVVPVVEAAVPPAAPEPDARITEALATMNAVTARLQAREQTAIMEGLITASGLPAAIGEMIRTEIGTQVMESAAIQAIIDRYVAAGRAVLQESVSLTNQTLIAFRGSTVMEGNQVTPLDQVSAALDEWFGNPNPDMKGKYRSIESMKQFYVAVTGDHSGGVDGVYNAKESVIGSYLGMQVQEALPGQTHIVGGSTITLPSLFGVSMNRMLTKQYRGQNLWWEPIVDKKKLNNFKEQERTKLHNFGSLTQRTVGTEEYTELDWAETKEVYTPTGYGNLVPINRRAFINDDLSGLQAIPKLLGQSAAFTINEVVANLFLANSGSGVTLTDTLSVFHASHQANKGTAALDQASLEAAIVLVSGMTNEAAKAIGWRLRHLLLPNSLMPTGYRLTQSERTPGTANNDPNFIRSQWGIDNVIYVPQFNADANNWYAMADPSEIVLIELGFILGREDPEFFIQNGATEGIVFTNDVINYKIRHEYGGDFLDYRGAYASIVA